MRGATVAAAVARASGARFGRRATVLVPPDAAAGG
jgi:hypothetical protein